MDEHGNTGQFANAGNHAGDDELLAAFTGPKNAHYYSGAFHAFARGENVKWNWPALFITFPWMLYRKMWLFALGYIIGLHVLMQFVFLFGGVSPSSQFLLSFIVFFVLTPLFATRLYYAHARSKIGSIKLRTNSPEEQQLEVARAGGTSVVGIVVGVLIIVVPTVGGIIAAISIPAYNDYGARAQVSEGLNLSGGAKAAVKEYYMDRGELPADNATAGLVPANEIQGRYVSSVRVENGEIFISYGNDANSDVYGGSLILRPTPKEGSIFWTCMSPDIPLKYVPGVCQP